MPLYTFECLYCGKDTDKFFKIDNCPKYILCPICGDDARKVIVSGHGSIQCDNMVDVPWLESAVQNLQPDHERPIETRGEYNRYLKENNIIAAG